MDYWNRLLTLVYNDTAISPFDRGLMTFQPTHLILWDEESTRSVFVIGSHTLAIIHFPFCGKSIAIKKNYIN